MVLGTYIGIGMLVYVHIEIMSNFVITSLMWLTKSKSCSTC